MNLYFLFIGVLQLWSVITPVNPLSTWGAIGFIFALSGTLPPFLSSPFFSLLYSLTPPSASKEAVDDYRRYARDKKANTRPYYVVRNGRKQRVLLLIPFLSLLPTFYSFLFMFIFICLFIFDRCIRRRY